MLQSRDETSAELSLRCIVRDEIDVEESALIVSGLGASHTNITLDPPIPDRTSMPLSCVALATGSDDGAERVVGGLIGSTNWNWLSIKYLWVDEALRGKGVGKQLVEAAEARAKEQRGCIGAHVDTHSFQAKGFYIKLGFEVFGEIDDYPIGHTRIYLKKRFVESSD